MQKNPALATPASPSRPPRLDARIPVQFAEAAALTLSVSAPAPASGSLGSANAAALSLAAGPAQAADDWDDVGVARSSSPLSDWPL